MATKQFQNAKLNVTHLDLKDDASRSVLQSGENISHSLGKIARWYKDIIWTDSKATTEVFGIVKLSDDYKSESTETVPTSKTLNDVVKLIKQTGGWNTTYDFNSNIEGDENLQNGQFKVTEHDLEGDFDHYVSIKGLGSAAFTDSNEYATAGHTHLYAGSDSVGGAATSANKLNTDAGSDINPIYFSNGIPVACTYSLNKTVPSNALFTDAKVKQTTTTTDADYEILFSSTADNTTRTEGARKNSNLTFNPSTGVLTTTKFVGELSGTATTATTANKLSNTTAIGSSIKPVYFSADGIPVAIDHSIETSVPSNAVFTDTTYTVSSGDNNGQIKVTPSEGDPYNVSVKGLGSAAYTDSDEYATADHTHKYAGSSSVGGVANSAAKLSDIPTAGIGSEAKPVFFSGTTGRPVACTYSLNATVPANAIFTDEKVKQSPVTTDGSFEVLFAGSTGNTEKTEGVGKTTTLTFNPSTGALSATSFSGNGSGLTTLNASNISSGTLSVNRLPGSAVTIGTYGPAAGGTLSHSGTFDVPDFTVDAKGRITGAHTRTFTLPAQYTHPSHTSKVSGLYKITVDSLGHVSGTTAVTKSDIPALDYISSTTTRNPNVVLAGPASGTTAAAPTFRALVVTDLPSSGATAGSYGPSANATPGYGATFNVPYITVDAKGRVTGIENKTVKIPASDNTNTTYLLSGAYGSSSNTWVTTLTPSSGSATTSTVPTGSTSAYGLMKLYNGVDSTSTALAATANAVKTAYDKANHSHPYLPLAGGTMTGDITFAGVSSTEYPALSNQIYFSGSTDWARILYEVTASDAGQLVFETGDDANAKIVFRNKVTSGGTYTRQVTIADGVISGNGSGLTSLNASNISSGTLSADRLAASGVTAGSYGPSANATPGYGSTFNVPYITVDAKGRVTAISTKTVKIPASDNTNTTYTFATGDNNGTFKVTPSGGTATNIAIKGLGSAAYTASSAYATSVHAHGLGHSNFTVAINSTTNTWAAIGVDGTNKYVLKSIRTNTNAPPYLLNDFSAGIVFGGEDTRGVISMKYNTPSIRFAGGNKTAVDGGTAVWYITLTGTHNTTYNLDTMHQVTQTATSTSAAYEVLFSGTADNTTRTEGARKNSNLTFNPSTGVLTATKFDGQIVGKKYEDYDPFSTKHDHHPVLFYQDGFGSPSKVGYASLGFTYDSIHGELFSGGMNCGVLNTKIIDMSGTTDDPNSEINYKGTKATHTMIKFIDNAGDTYGNGIVIGGGGLVVVGAGESANNLVSAASLSGGQEKLYLTSDSEIYFYTNCNTIGDRKGMTLNTALSLYPNSNNTGSVGTSSYKWASMYATTFYGAFSGSGASVTSLNASNISSGTLSADRLATSGVTAGSYGPSTNASPAHSGTFNVPYITVDNKGRVMAIATRTITLPASGNTDTKVTQSAISTAKFRGVILGTNNTVNTGDNRETTVTGQGYITNKIFAQPSTGNLYASNIYAFVNGTDEVRIALYRSGNSSWRFLNSGGTLSLQNNYYNSAVQSWYNVAQFDFGGTNAIKLMTPPQLTGTNRSTTYGYSTIDMAICSKNSWAMSMRWLNNARNAVRGSFGAYGTADNLTYYYWGNEYNATKLRLYPGTGGGLVSQQSNGFRIATNGYGVIFRVDSDNFYILLTDKKTDGSELTGDNWNSKRPLQIGLSSGVCNINGTASTAKKLKYCTLCNEASDAASYPWYRIAYAYTTNAYSDLNLVMMVTCGFGSKWGIFKARARTEGTAGTFGGTVTIEWLVNDGFTNAQLYLLTKNNYQVDTAKSGTATAEIWFKSDGRYWGYTFTVLHEGWRTGTASDLWALSSYTKNGSESYNKNASGVKSATSSKIYSTNTPGSSSHAGYSIPFFSGPINSSSPEKNDTAASGNKTVLHNGEFRLGLLEGTTSTDGYAQLVLGNGIASGTAGNKYGKISLYSSSAYAVQIIPANVTGTRTLTLPNASGTVALTSHTHSYIPTSSAATLFSGTAAASITMTSMSGYTRLVVFCKNTSNSSYFTVELQCVTGYHYHAMTVSPPPAAQTSNSFYGLLFNLSSNTKLSVSAGKYSNLSSSASLANGPTVHITKVIGYKF